MSNIKAPYGWLTSAGYIGYVDGIAIMFPTEGEYLEYLYEHDSEDE